MSWALIITLAAVVFFNRYLFLEPRMPVRLPRFINETLKYSAPCLLTAICGPIILFENVILRSFPDNYYLWGALCSIVFSLFIRNLLLAILLSLTVFYLLQALL